MGGIIHDTTEIKEEVKEEIRQMFNEIYCGMPLPYISQDKIMYFLEKGLNMYEKKLWENIKLKIK